MKGQVQIVRGLHMFFCRGTGSKVRQLTHHVVVRHQLVPPTNNEDDDDFELPASSTEEEEEEEEQEVSGWCMDCAVMGFS